MRGPWLTPSPSRMRDCCTGLWARHQVPTSCGVCFQIFRMPEQRVMFFAASRNWARSPRISPPMPPGTQMAPKPSSSSSAVASSASARAPKRSSMDQMPILPRRFLSAVLISSSIVLPGQSIQPAVTPQSAVQTAPCTALAAGEEMKAMTDATSAAWAGGRMPE